MIGPGGAFVAPWAAAGWLARGCWKAAGRAVDTLAFATACPICDADAEGSGFCPGCRLELLEAHGRACPRCAMPVGPYSDVSGGCSECRGHRLGFDAAIALGPYQGPIRQVCLMLKRDRNAWVARWLAGLVAEGRADAIRVEVEAAAGSGACLVPVPLHWRRRLARGYNQAEALASGLGRAIGLEVSPALRRVVATPQLALAGRAERARRMRGAFRVRRGADLRGRTVLLVDDILTSGATSGEAARALKRAGAARVVAVVVARAEGKP